jgi:serine protease Do
MKFGLSNTKVGTAAFAAFAGGLLVAGAFDLTPFSHAQSNRMNAGAYAIPAAHDVAGLSNAFVAIAEAVTPAVVSIKAESPELARAQRSRAQQAPRSNPFNFPPDLEELLRGQQEMGPEPAAATGTGFIVSRDGYILTNNHVITRRDRSTRQEKVTVTLADSRVFPASIIGNDPETDVAVLKIDAPNLAVAALGDDNKTRIGEWVLAIGNPLGLDFTVTAGIVSAKGRNEGGGTGYQISDFLQTDAAINPGNSGGPLLNVAGEVVGINSMIASNSGFYQGYGFAIPITLANDIMNNLIEFGSIKASVLGVSITAVDPDDAAINGLKSISGVLVRTMPDTVNSPAGKAGIKIGDVILAVNDREIDRVGTLQRVVRSYRPGTTVDVKVVRDGQPKTIRVTLEERKDTPSAASAASAPARAPTALTFDKLGISAEVVTPTWLEQNRVTGPLEGLAVTEVAPGRTSAEKLRGAIITEVVRPGPATVIAALEDLERVLSRVKVGDVVSFRVRGIESADGQRRTPTQPIVINVRIGS